MIAQRYASVRAFRRLIGRYLQRMVEMGVDPHGMILSQHGASWQLSSGQDHRGSGAQPISPRAFCEARSVCTQEVVSHKQRVAARRRTSSPREFPYSTAASISFLSWACLADRRIFSRAVPAVHRALIGDEKAPCRDSGESDRKRESRLRDGSTMSHCLCSTPVCRNGLPPYRTPLVSRVHESCVVRVMMIRAFSDTRSPEPPPRLSLYPRSASTLHPVCHLPAPVAHCSRTSFRAGYLCNLSYVSPNV